MGRSMALNNTMSDVNGVRGMGTQCAIAYASTNACSVMELGMENNYAASLTKGAELDEYAVSLTTTPGWPTLTVHRMSGPSDGEKDVDKGVMS
jgi:hypothetical protein